MLALKTILELDDDVLLLILELADARRCLSMLSATCRRIRALSKPVLFAHICLRPSGFTPRSFIVNSIRPHVRTIQFTHQCFFVPAQHNDHHRPGARHRVRDSSPDSQFLLDAMRGMTRLRNVIVNTTMGNGLPFYILDAILSAPQLCSVQCGPSMCLPVNEDPTFPKHLRLTGPVAPLTSFRRAQPSHKRCSRVPAEVDFLYCLFKHIHSTLQVAEMPRDNAPLKAFSNNDWPCLRELVLRGGPIRSSRALMIENLTRMPNLRILRLELAHFSKTGPQRICPSGWAGGCPWPNLEVLTVSNPHPDDELYANLPDSLRELTIRCFPRHYVMDGPRTHDVSTMERGNWGSSLLTSAEMLRVLRQCGTLLVHLRHLDIEFAASSEDVVLLRHVATTYPTLTFLQFCRYHKELQYNVASWAAFGNALIPLTKLQLLRVHLDLQPLASTNDTGMATEALAALSRSLSPTVRFVCWLVRYGGKNDWIPHRIVRDPTTGEMVEIECAGEYERIDGYWTQGALLSSVDDIKLGTDCRGMALMDWDEYQHFSLTILYGPLSP